MAIVNAISSVGTCMSFSAVLPAPPASATEYAALTWVPWEAITNYGDVGGTDTISNETPVCDGIVQKIHGPRDNGTMDLTALHDDAHAGQLLIEAAYQARDRIACKIELINGGIVYFIAIVAAAPLSIGDASSNLKIMTKLDITSAVIRIAS